MYAPKERLQYPLSDLLEFHQASLTPYFLHWHNELEIVLARKGPVYYMVNQNRLVLQTGEALFINGGDIHNISGYDSSGEAYLLVISPEAFPREIPRTSLCSTKLKPEDTGALFCIVREIAEEYGAARLYREEAMLALIHLLVYSLLRVIDRGDPQGFTEQIPHESDLCRAILDFFEKSPPACYHLEALSQRLGYTKYYLCKVFKSIFGRTFYQYAQDLKLYAAQELLKETRLSVEEVAAESGFSSSRAFHTAFKKRNGVSPSAFRRNCQGS